MHLPIGISEPLVLGIGEKDLSKCIPFETLKHDFHPRKDNMEKGKQCAIGEHIKYARGMEVGENSYERGRPQSMLIKKSRQ